MPNYKEGPDYRSVNSIAETERRSKNLWDLGVCFSTLLNCHTMVSCLFHDLQRKAFFSTRTALGSKILQMLQKKCKQLTLSK